MSVPNLQASAESVNVMVGLDSRLAVYVLFADTGAGSFGGTIQIGSVSVKTHWPTRPVYEYEYLPYGVLEETLKVVINAPKQFAGLLGSANSSQVQTPEKVTPGAVVPRYVILDGSI